MKVFITNVKLKVNSVGIYNPMTKECIVLKGSIVSQDISKAKSFRGSRAIETKREKTVRDCVVIEDTIFKSSSTAGNSVTGRSTDGLSAWKDEAGRSLREALILNK